MCTHTCTRTHTRAPACTRAPAPACTCTHAPAPMHAHAHPHAHPHAYAHPCTPVRTCAHPYAPARLRTHLHACLHTCTRMHPRHASARCTHAPCMRDVSTASTIALERIRTACSPFLACSPYQWGSTCEKRLVGAVIHCDQFRVRK